MYQEKLKQALLEINRVYAKGCAEHYSKKNPDPWQAEHDRLEAMLRLGSVEDIKGAIDSFESGCKHLIEAYKK